MGKLIFFITLLIFIDLFFIATGVACAGSSCTLSSVIFNAIISLDTLTFGQMFSELIGNVSDIGNSTAGFAALLVGGGIAITAAFLATRQIELLLIPVAATFGLITGDFIIIASYLFAENSVLGMFVMAPISIIYVLTVLEWWRGKD